jgi:uncharacterized protein
MDLTFLLTEDCNLRCAYCYQPQFRPVAMAAETGIQALRQAIHHGAENLALTFFGGEPLLNTPSLWAILRAARSLEREHGIPVTAKVSTNGLLLDEPFLREAALLGLFVSLSCDGNGPAQDAGRVRPTGEGSSAEVTRALRLLVAARRPFAVYSVVTPANVRWFARSRQWLWDEGARILVSALDYTATWDAPALEELERQYRRVGRMYAASLRRKAGFHLEPFDSRIGLRTRGNNQRCAPGLSQVTVAPDGALYGCLEYFHRRLSPLGDVARWLDQEAVRALCAPRAARPEECQDCGVRDRCNTACACVNLRGTGDPARPPTALCLSEQLLIQSVDRIAAGLWRKRVPEFLLRQYSDSYHFLSGIEALLTEMGIDHEHAATR